MNFLYRLSYYLFGFIIGMFFLMFFFSGKKTSCNYLPSKRVKNDLLKKQIIIPSHLKKEFIFLNDSILYSQKPDPKTVPRPPKSVQNGPF